MRILFVASEVTPVVKVGGLADVVGSLPKALADLDHDVRVMIPFYGSIERGTLKTRPAWTGLPASFGGREWKIDIAQTALPDSTVPLYLLDCPNFFSENGVYIAGHSSDAQRRGLQRFVAFSSFVGQIVPQLDWQPDIVHVHDWHAGLVPLALTRSGSVIKTVLTIHNLHNQGVWNPDEIFDWLGWEGHDQPMLELRDSRGDLNILQLAIHSAHNITTVSPTYAQEIFTPGYGEGLENDLLVHQPKLVGILNGLDVQAFDPVHDRALVERYSIESVGIAKQKNKEALQHQLGLAPAQTAPLFVAVSRLSPQKGFDLLPPVINDIVRAGGQVAILGSGWPEIEGQLHHLADEHPRSVVVVLKFDPILAQRMYAGGDFFLMPSRFEPCGLGQLISMRYGTVPVVRDTGGLHDTVIDVIAHPDRGTGFVFSRFDATDFRQAITAALRLYQQPATLRSLIQRAMRQDFSWAHSAEAYLKLYAQT